MNHKWVVILKGDLESIPEPELDAFKQEVELAFRNGFGPEEPPFFVEMPPGIEVEFRRVDEHTAAANFAERPRYAVGALQVLLSASCILLAKFAFGDASTSWIGIWLDGAGAVLMVWGVVEFLRATRPGR